MVVGHQKVTERAYAQSRERRDEAARFAAAAVHNGLGHRHGLDRGVIMKLTAQIERDYLVALMAREPESPIAGAT